MYLNLGQRLPTWNLHKVVNQLNSNAESKFLKTQFTLYVCLLWSHQYLFITLLSMTRFQILKSAPGSVLTNTVPPRHHMITSSRSHPMAPSSSGLWTSCPALSSQDLSDQASTLLAMLSLLLHHCAYHSLDIITLFTSPVYHWNTDFFFLLYLGTYFLNKIFWWNYVPTLQNLWIYIYTHIYLLHSQWELVAGGMNFL